MSGARVGMLVRFLEVSLRLSRPVQLLQEMRSLDQNITEMLPAGVPIIFRSSWSSDASEGDGLGVSVEGIVEPA